MENHEACAGCAAGAPLSSSIDRRRFLSASALAAAALLGACSATDALGPSAPGASGTFTVNVADYASLDSVGGVALLSASGYPLAVVRTDSGYEVFSRICPHQGATVGTISGGFQCPRHGATWNLSGQWEGGERTTNLRVLTSSYDPATGELTIG